VGDVPEGPAQDGLVGRVVSWLRAGYPDGVPQQDHLALLGILRRSLTASELDSVVDQLTDDAAARQHLMTRPLVERRIAEVVRGPIDDGDVARVSARLAAAGWPLGPPEPRPADETRDGVVTKVVDWLRAGYPSGLPDQDFVPLVALLRRRLSDPEVTEVARVLARDGVIATDRVDIGSAIAKVTSELPSERDVERVRSYVATGAGDLTG
jgi:hypothetical protein